MPRQCRLYIIVHDQRGRVVLADSPRPRGTGVVVQEDGPLLVIRRGLEKFWIVSLDFADSLGCSHGEKMFS